MASYRVVLRPSLEKDLRSVPKAEGQRIWARIEALGDDPMPRQSVKLAGSEDLYRIRVGDYQVIYGLDDEAKVVTVH